MSNHFPNSVKLSPTIPYPGLSSVSGWGQGHLLAMFSWHLPQVVSEMRLHEEPRGGSHGCCWMMGFRRVGVIVGLDGLDSQTNPSKEVSKRVQTDALLLCFKLFV